MPVFDYVCKGCGEEFEKLILNVKDCEVKCPKCSSTKVTRLIGAPSFRLYGEGFHKRNHKDTGEFAD